VARRLDLDVDSAPPAVTVLGRLTQAEPACWTFGFCRADGGGFVGASPELLVSKRAGRVASYPLAGTVALGEDALAADALLGSDKTLEEHALVVADVATILSGLCDQLEVPESPSPVPLRTMAHLGTRIEGTLRGSTGWPSALDLVAALHPTPAVGGVPRRDALTLIAELEPGPRGPWAGPVGWMDADGDGDWVIGIRSATLEQRSVTVWAGAGIVAASDPQAELAETTVKLTTVIEEILPGSTAVLSPCSTTS
jgi:isochorismate synthase